MLILWTKYRQTKLNKLPLKTDYYKTDFIHARAYLDYAIEMIYENKLNAATLTYAIKVLSGKNLTKNAETYCVETIINVSIYYPYFVTILEKFMFSKSFSRCLVHDYVERYTQKNIF